MTRDLSNISYEAWVDFVFNHRVTEITVAWYTDDEWEYVCSAETAIAHLTRLFRNSTELVQKFSMEQIEQGFWFLPSMYGFMRSILSPEVTFEKRRICIESISVLFDDLFCRHGELNISCYMWWDSVFSYCALNGKNLGNEMEVLDQVAATISKLLHTGCHAAKESAVHGVEHLIEVYRSVKSSEIERIITAHFDLSTLGMELEGAKLNRNAEMDEYANTVREMLVKEIRAIRELRKKTKDSEQT